MATEITEPDPKDPTEEAINTLQWNSAVVKSAIKYKVYPKGAIIQVGQDTVNIPVGYAAVAVSANKFIPVHPDLINAFFTI